MSIRAACSTLLVLALAASLSAAQSRSKDAAGLIPVKLKTNISRTWQEVQEAKYAYGPRQEIDGDSGETRVWLPYGSDTGLYHEVQGVLTDPGTVANNGRSTLVNPADASTSCFLTYKVVFNKPINAFRFEISWQELHLAERSAAGTEYSLDGKKWKTIQEVKGTDPGMQGGMKMGGSFGKGITVDGIATQVLFLRVYARDAQDPEQRRGDTRWIRIILSGDPAWGDASRTFFASQPQLWVSSGKRK